MIADCRLPIADCAGEGTQFLRSDLPTERSVSETNRSIPASFLHKQPGALVAIQGRHESKGGSAEEAYA
jgi:hypothetical protein